MLLPVLLALAAATAEAERTVVIDGRQLAIAASAHVAGHALPVNLLISADEPTLLATLLHGAWTPEDAAAEKVERESPVLLAGRAPDLELEHAGAHIDERLTVMLWRRPERLRGLALWVGVTVKEAGIQPLSPPPAAPVVSREALDRVLAAFSFGLSQARVVAAPPRVTWVELVEAPAGAENLLFDLPRDDVPRPRQKAATVPRLQPLPPLHPVSAEVIARPEAGRRVALTFDACSTLDRSFYDDRITRVMVETKTPATLFISGRWAEKHLRQMRVLAGNPLFEIANHSYIHPHMTEVPPERDREELLWTQQILLTLTGKLPRFFRPPYGEIDAQLAQVAAQNGLRTVEFDFPSGDPDRHSTRDRLVAWVLAKARPGSIIVMHMNRRGWHTAEALPDIIAGLRGKGFVLSQVGEMVGP